MSVYTRACQRVDVRVGVGVVCSFELLQLCQVISESNSSGGWR